MHHFGLTIYYSNGLYRTLSDTGKTNPATIFEGEYQLPSFERAFRFQAIIF